MTETSKQGYFVLTIAKEDWENGFVLGRKLSDTVGDLFGSRLLDTRYYPHDPTDVENRCWTCGGDPDSHPSGIKCICEDGTHTSEVVNLRKLASKVSISSTPTSPRAYSADDVVRTMRFVDPWSGIWESSGPASQDDAPPEDSRTKGDNSMSDEDEQLEELSIVLDLKHPRNLKAQNIFLEFLQSWNVSDVVQELERKGISILARLAPPQDAEGERGGEVEKEHTKEGKVQTEKVDLATEQWSSQWLRGYLIDAFNLPATSDNWIVLEKVRLEGQHWRSAIHKIQDMIGIQRGDGPTTVEAVKKRIYGTPGLEAQLHSLERENARLHGVIEGMGKR